MTCRRTLRDDDEGAILVLWAVALAVMLGLVALSFDTGRMASTQSELQGFADQVALAAAGELDGHSDAITRATDAANRLITDSQTYATGGRDLGGEKLGDQVQDFTLTFYSALPADDSSALTAVTTNPADAIYVRVTVPARRVPFTFAAAFHALTGTQPARDTVGATAVAGFTQYACDITPMFFCLPSPTFRADAHIGHMVQLRAGGGGGAWAPGNFGFLDPDLFADKSATCAGLNGSKLDQCLLGAEGAITQCVNQRGVDTVPGQRNGIENAILNIRFDIFAGSVKNLSNKAEYSAAPNVIIGYKRKNKGSCGKLEPGTGQPGDTLGLPRDTCFENGTCGQSGDGERFGDGDWSKGRADYVALNYGTDPHPGAKTRYKYYLAEIASAGGPSSTTAILPKTSQETGRPICAKKQSSDPDRRVLTVAGVDCGNITFDIHGRATGVPVKEFFRLFLTEPVGLKGANGIEDDYVYDTNNFDIFAEIVGSAQARGGSGSGGMMHDVVQLYR